MPKKITQNVNKDKLFNDEPIVKVPTSSWIGKVTNYQSCNLGQIVPIFVESVLPGEKRKALKLGMVSHLQTPVAPFFNALYTEIRTFFIPKRLCCDLLNGYSTRKSPWVKVFGEDNKSTDASIVVPLAEQRLPDLYPSEIVTDLYNYMEDNTIPADNVFNSLDMLDADGDGSHIYYQNFLSLAAYELVYQRHYRNELYESSTASLLYRSLFNAYNIEDRGLTPLCDGKFTFEKANREKDYFTGSKPFTQKGDAPIVSIGGTAPVSAVNATTSEDIALSISLADSVSANQRTELMASGGTKAVDNDFPVKFIADLTQARGVSINELRLLIKTQELLEKDLVWGSKYAESLNAHFGCAPLDTTLQDPQELYRTYITSNMQAIFQTSSTDNEASILGTIGANSTTQAETIILPETTFKEHGFIMVCAVHKLQNVYDTRYFKPRDNFKQHRFDFYTPELNDLGYQKSFDGESPLGTFYNEAFAEYRYKFNKIHGSLAKSFPYWAPGMADEYASVSTIYKEDTDILDKALSVRSDEAPQFFDAWGFEDVETKPMSLHSIPGMDGVI